MRAMTIRAEMATLPDPANQKTVAQEIMPAMVAGAMDRELATAMQEWSEARF